MFVLWMFLQAQLKHLCLCNLQYIQTRVWFKILTLQFFFTLFLLSLFNSTTIPPKTIYPSHLNMQLTYYMARGEKYACTLYQIVYSRFNVHVFYFKSFFSFFPRFFFFPCSILYRRKRRRYCIIFNFACVSYNVIFICILFHLDSSFFPAAAVQ